MNNNINVYNTHKSCLQRTSKRQSIKFIGNQLVNSVCIISSTANSVTRFFLQFLSAYTHTPSLYLCSSASFSMGVCGVSCEIAKYIKRKQTNCTGAISTCYIYILCMYIAVRESVNFSLCNAREKKSDQTKPNKTRNETNIRTIHDEENGISLEDQCDLKSI